MFGQMMHGVWQDFVRYVMHVDVKINQPAAPQDAAVGQANGGGATGNGGDGQVQDAQVQDAVEDTALRNVQYSSPEDPATSGGAASMAAAARAGRRAAATAAGPRRRPHRRRPTRRRSGPTGTRRRATPPARAGRARSTSSVTVGSGPRAMRDLSDDLKALSAPPRRGRELPARSTSCGPAGPSSRPRPRAPTCGTTRPVPGRSPASCRRSATTSTLYDAPDVPPRRRRDAARAGAGEERRRRRSAEIERVAGRPRCGASPSSSCARCSPASTTSGDALVTIQSGEGGTDAQDWAEMLLRMYPRWAERRGFDVEVDEVTEGTEAGISSATFVVKGRYAYGLAPGRAGRPPPGAHVARSTPRASARRRSPPSRSCRCSTRATTSRSTRRTSHRHLPVVGRRRPARQRDRLGGAHHPPPDRHRRVVPERAQPAPEQGPGDADAQGQARRPASGRSARPSWTTIRGDQQRVGLRQPDPLLRAAAVPDGQGPADRARDRQRRTPCSTASSTRSWRPTCGGGAAGADEVLTIRVRRPGGGLPSRGDVHGTARYL